MSDKKIELLNSLLTQIEASIPMKDKTNNSVSKVDVGWQLDHSLKVINGVCGILQKTNPNKYKRNFNVLRSVLFTLNYFPRGRAKAPKIVIPPESITFEDLKNQLELAKTNIKNIAPLDKHAFFIHHIFGSLSKSQTMRFLELHTKHHLKIVNDIIKP